MTAPEASFVVVSSIIRDRTVTSVIYLGVISRNIAPGVLGRDIALATPIWRIGTWFLVTLAWSHSVWVVVIDVGMLGLIYHGTGARTCKPGILGSNILFDVLIWRT